MTRLIGLAFVLIASVGSGLPCSAADDSVKQDDGLKRLEKRVADLEKEVAELRAQLKLPAKAAADNKLVGNWAAKDKKAELQGLRLDLDGTCSILATADGPIPEFWKGKHEMVGNYITLNSMVGRSEKVTINIKLEFVSVNEKELIVKYHGTEIRLERQ
jgi:hypothetical protein